MSAVRGHVLCLLLTPALLWLSGSVAAQQPTIKREYAIKAGVIGMLGKFVTWPDEEVPGLDVPLLIGILGQDPFDENGVNQLQRTIDAEKQKGRKIEVKQFDSAKDYQPCHILFVSHAAAERSEEKSLADRLRAAQRITSGAPVLVVGEGAGLAQQGVIANLIFDRAANRIRLELNPDAASRARLKLSAELLRFPLAQIVRDK